MERNYQMTRLGKGDYLCPSNDLGLMWRFCTFEDGRAHGLQVDYELRTFWRALYMPMERFKYCAEGGEIPGQWASPPWTEADWYLPSRAACIEKMLAHAEAPISR